MGQDLLSSPAEPAKQNGTWRDHLGRNTWPGPWFRGLRLPQVPSPHHGGALPRAGQQGWRVGEISLRREADAAAWRGLLASLACLGEALGEAFQWFTGLLQLKAWVKPRQHYPCPICRKHLRVRQSRAEILKIERLT